MKPKKFNKIINSVLSEQSRPDDYSDKQIDASAINGLMQDYIDNGDRSVLVDILNHLYKPVLGDMISNTFSDSFINLIQSNYENLETTAQSFLSDERINAVRQAVDTSANERVQPVGEQVDREEDVIDDTAETPTDDVSSTDEQGIDDQSYVSGIQEEMGDILLNFLEPVKMIATTFIKIFDTNVLNGLSQSFESLERDIDKNLAEKFINKIDENFEANNMITSYENIFSMFSGVMDDDNESSVNNESLILMNYKSYAVLSEKKNGKLNNIKTFIGALGVGLSTVGRKLLGLGGVVAGLFFISNMLKGILKIVMLSPLSILTFAVDFLKKYGSTLLTKLFFPLGSLMMGANIIRVGQASINVGERINALIASVFNFLVDALGKVIATAVELVKGSARQAGVDTRRQNKPRTP